MIFYGALRKLTTRWCGDAEGTLQNDLVGGEGGLVSAEPAARLMRMAALAERGRRRLPTCWSTATVRQSPRRCREQPAFDAEYREYLEKFGERAVNELKLETETLHDDPLPLWRAIGQLERQQRGRGQSSTASAGHERRASAERRAFEALASHPLRRLAFRWVLRHARARVRDRENLRLERTRLFGRVRRIFVEIGRRFHAAELLADPRDVFYLEVDEVLGLVEGRSTCTSIRSLAALRRAEFAAFERAPAPPSRFETRGIVSLGQTFASSESVAPAGGDERRGQGCCPGVVRGPVRIVRDPRRSICRRARFSSPSTPIPGWILVLPSALGVLVERGSLLSHAAIVTRELGIPSIVALPGITPWLADGDWVEMDGRAGTVKRMQLKDRQQREAHARELSYRAKRPHARISAPSATRRSGRTPTSCSKASTCSPGDVCVSIASAGDNALALLTRDPAQVIALDLNPAQLACLELRVAAYRALTHAELLELVGLTPVDAAGGALRALPPRPHRRHAAVLGRATPPRSLPASAAPASSNATSRCSGNRVLPLVHSQPARAAVAHPARAARHGNASTIASWDTLALAR